jgi:hypothetical protein
MDAEFDGTTGWLGTTPLRRAAMIIDLPAKFRKNARGNSDFA